METQNEIKEESVKMDEVIVGEDVPQVIAKKVLIEDYEIVPVEIKSKEVGDKLVLKVKHPDVNQTVDISSVKRQMGDKLKVTGLWCNLDKDGKIPYKSALGAMLRFLGKSTIKDLKGEQVDTVENENGYLAIKAY